MLMEDGGKPKTRDAGFGTVPKATPRSTEQLAEPTYTRRKEGLSCPAPAKRAISRLACRRDMPSSSGHWIALHPPTAAVTSGDAKSSTCFTCSAEYWMLRCLLSGSTFPWWKKRYGGSEKVPGMPAKSSARRGRLTSPGCFV